MGNPEGPHALVSEYVGTQLAEWFGLSTFDYALVELTDDEIPFAKGESATPGPAFITRKEDGETCSGTALRRIAKVDRWQSRSGDTSSKRRAEAKEPREIGSLKQIQ